MKLLPPDGYTDVIGSDGKSYQAVNGVIDIPDEQMPQSSWGFGYVAIHEGSAQPVPQAVLEPVDEVETKPEE